MTEEYKPTLASAIVAVEEESQFFLATEKRGADLRHALAILRGLQWRPIAAWDHETALFATTNAICHTHHITPPKWATHFLLVDAIPLPETQEVK